MLTFDEAFDRLIDHEGGYVNNPNDPGGETKFGISKRSYPALNIANLSREMAKAIYLKDFWLPIGAAAHPVIKYQVFDFAVNSGIQTAIRALQRVLGVAPDGHFGPVSQRALANTPVETAAMLLLAERLDFMARLSTWPNFGRGWARRVVKNLRLAVTDLGASQ